MNNSGQKGKTIGVIGNAGMGSLMASLISVGGADVLGTMLAPIFSGKDYDDEQKPDPVRLIDATTHTVVPAGANKYYFNSQGYSSKTSFVDDVFTCIAINDMSARKKFNKWKKNNHEK